MNDHTRLTRASDCSSCTLDDEAVLMSLSNGEYYELTPVATRIWELLNEPSTRGEIVQTLLQEYEVAETPCREQVDEFLEFMLAEELLRCADEKG